MRPVTMISRKSLFNLCIVFSVAFATAISGCRLPRAKCRVCHRGNCHQVIKRQRPVVIDANPYNCPQNAAAFEQSPAIDSNSIAPPEKHEVAPGDAKEIESIPEVDAEEIEEVAPGDSLLFSPPSDSTQETIAQLQPPIAETIPEADHAPEPAQVAEEVIQPDFSPAPAPIQRPNVDQSADKKPYYIFKEQKPKTLPESNVATTAPTNNETPTEREPGAIFDQLAEEIFSEIDLQEKLDLSPTNNVPSQPASFTPPNTNNTGPQTDSSNNIVPAPTESEEIFGAIQFDAVLRQSQEGHYAQEVETNEPRVAAIDSRDAYLMRPLPEMNQPMPRVSSQPIQFQPMPAYHMPTLRAIPQTRDREELPSVFKIRLLDAPPEQPRNIVVRNPYADGNQPAQQPAQTDTKIIAVPVDPENSIKPLPAVQQAPANQEFQATSDRRLTERNNIQNPLR